MRAVVQRVSRASVESEGCQVGSISKGLLVLLGVGDGDTEEDLKYIHDKIINLRIFEDREGKLNLSLMDVQGDIQVVSQFTLYGDARKGRRPSFIEAARPELADPLYKELIRLLKKNDRLGKVAEGAFGTHMMVDLTNDGPITILLDSRKGF